MMKRQCFFIGLYCIAIAGWANIIYELLYNNSKISAILTLAVLGWVFFTLWVAAQDRDYED